MRLRRGENCFDRSMLKGLDDSKSFLRITARSPAAPRSPRLLEAARAGLFASERGLILIQIELRPRWCFQQLFIANFSCFVLA